MMSGYRKELKFIVGPDVLADVKNRMCTVMKQDPHQHGDHYRIRSLYLDSPDLKCFRENAAGVSPREKYRIRIYNCEDSVIKAEIKIRHRDTISKMSAPISRKMFDAVLSGGSACTDAIDDAVKAADEAGDETKKRVFEKYLARLASDGYKNAVIIDYERSAYVYDIANVRITFDKNTYASTDFYRMFEKNINGRAVLDKGQHILEIKYDEFLPEEIKMLLSGVRLERTSCSKYALGLKRFSDMLLI